MILLTTLLACAGHRDAVEVPTPPAVEVPAPPTAEVPTSAPAAPPPPSLPPPPAPMNPGERLVGQWISASCGEREYPRELLLTPDFRYTMRDLVSPCPPGAACIWSGVVTSSGTWTSADGSYQLTEEGVDIPDKTSPRSTRLDKTDGGLVDELGCSFTPMAPQPLGAPQPPQPL